MMMVPSRQATASGGGACLLSLAGVARICLVALCLGHLVEIPRVVAAKPLSSDALWPTMSSPAPWAGNSVPGKRNTEQHGGHRTNNRETCPTSCRCNLFLWNFVSYFKYQQTTYQARLNTFEGRGGKKFVRIQPDTVLERWYSQYRNGELKTDACFLCGHSWEDHLEYWWFCRRRGKETAFDRYIATGSGLDGSNKFYRRYVDEIDRRKRRRFLRRGKEVRESSTGEVSYAVSPFDPLADGLPKGVGSVLTLALARAASLERVDDLIWLSAVDKLKRKR